MVPNAPSTLQVNRIPLKNGLLEINMASLLVISMERSLLKSLIVMAASKALNVAFAMEKLSFKRFHGMMDNYMGQQRLM